MAGVPLCSTANWADYIGDENAEANLGVRTLSDKLSEPAQPLS
jgi:hypothetical protein